MRKSDGMISSKPNLLTARASRCRVCIQSPKNGGNPLSWIASCVLPFHRFQATNKRHFWMPHAMRAPRPMRLTPTSPSVRQCSMSTDTSTPGAMSKMRPTHKGLAPRLQHSPPWCSPVVARYVLLPWQALVANGSRLVAAAASVCANSAAPTPPYSPPAPPRLVQSTHWPNCCRTASAPTTCQVHHDLYCACHHSGQGPRVHPGHCRRTWFRLGGLDRTHHCARAYCICRARRFSASNRCRTQR